MMSMFFFLTQFLQDVRGYSALGAGLAFLPFAACTFLATRLTPRLLGRFGARPLVLAGLVLMVVGLSWLTRLTPDASYLAGVLGPVVVMGVGGGLGFTPLTPTIMQTVAAADTGAASGVLQTMQQTGAAMGVAVLVTVFGATVRHSGGSASVLVTGMTTAFAAGTLFAVVALAVALTLRRSQAGGDQAA